VTVRVQLVDVLVTRRPGIEQSEAPEVEDAVPGDRGRDVVSVVGRYVHDAVDRAVRPDAVDFTVVRPHDVQPSQK
jgi:hypothetical protein